MTQELCPAPNCPVGNMSDHISEMKSDIKEMRGENRELATMAANITDIKEDIKEIKDRENREHNEIFDRMRKVEADKVSKKDLVIVVSLFGTIFGAAFTLFNFMLKLAGKG